MNRFFGVKAAIGDVIVYVRADGIRVPTDWNTGGWKNGGGIGVDPVPADAALGDIGWEPMPTAAEAVALLAATANVSGWE